MITGAFTFFMFLFSSPEQAISKRLDGYWYVADDQTVQKRDLFRFYKFEKCEKFNGGKLCDGSFGWTKSPENFENMRDVVTFSYHIHEEAGKRKVYFLETDLASYHFNLDLKKDLLELEDKDSGESLRMVKLGKKKESENYK